MHSSSKVLSGGEGRSSKTPVVAGQKPMFPGPRHGGSSDHAVAMDPQMSCDVSIFLFWTNPCLK